MSKNNKKKGGKKKKPSNGSSGSPGLSVSDSAGTTGSDSNSPVPVNKTIEANPSPLNNETVGQQSPLNKETVNQQSTKESRVEDTLAKAPAKTVHGNPAQQESVPAKEDGKPSITVTTEAGEQQIVTSTNATTGDPAKCMCLTQ